MMKTRETGPDDDNVIPLSRAVDANAKRLCETLLGHHEEQLALCRKLEEVADELPEISDTQLCLHLARRIHPMIHGAHEYEEKTLFPMLMKMHDVDDRLKATVERLRYEHWEDESFADEV